MEIRSITIRPNTGKVIATPMLMEGASRRRRLRSTPGLHNIILRRNVFFTDTGILDAISISICISVIIIVGRFITSISSIVGELV